LYEFDIKKMARTSVPSARPAGCGKARHPPHTVQVFNQA
jgi:hypothetical protein